jgi:hypothetical protein
VRGVFAGQRILGLFYAGGIAGTKDCVLAHVWYTLLAKGNFGSMLSDLNQEQQAEAKALAKNWKPGVALPDKSKLGCVE